jgi:hypothetical protein
MSTTEFPVPGSGAGITSQIEINRATPMVLRNSKFLCWVTMSGSFFAAFMSVCMLLMVFSVLSSGGGNMLAAAQWGFGALALGYMCIWLWKMGKAMLEYQVLLDSRGATFNLGTKKKPSDLFLAWDQVAAIRYGRVGNLQQCRVQGFDGSEARFSNYTFFRPKKVARMIAARTGLTLQKF